MSQLIIDNPGPLVLRYAALTSTSVDCLGLTPPSRGDLTQAQAIMMRRSQPSHVREEPSDLRRPLSNCRGRVFAPLASLKLLTLIGGPLWNDFRGEYMT
jgi:hypothetical protein